MQQLKLKNCSLQRDTSVVTTKLSQLQTQYKNDYFFAGLLTYDSSIAMSFMDCITQVENVVKLTQHRKI